MEEKKKKFPLSVYEIVLLIIVIPIVFYYSGKAFWIVLESGNHQWIPLWFVGIWGVFAIIGFNCLWISAMIFGSFKNIRIKIYTTIFILTVSSMFLFSFLVIKALSESMH